MDSKCSTTYQGIGFPGLLTIVFITLKLLGKIDWSWWWVLSPLWIGFAIFLVFMIAVFVMAGIVMLFTYKR